MQAWQILLAAALPAVAAASLLIITCYFHANDRGRKGGISTTRKLKKNESDLPIHGSNWQGDNHKFSDPGGITKRFKHGIMGKDPMGASLKQSSRFASAWRSVYPVKAFNWSEHPALVAEAVEHGWATFAFGHTQCDSPAPPTKLWDLCTHGSISSCIHMQGEPALQPEPETSWEVGTGADYVQKIRLNPGLPPNTEGEIRAVQSLQSTLPLPGPPLGPLSFPQEGYFEVTVVSHGQEGDGEGSSSQASSFNDNYNEHAKLIAAPRNSSSAGKHLRISAQKGAHHHPSVQNEVVQQSEGFAQQKGTHEAQQDELGALHLQQNGRLPQMGKQQEEELQVQQKGSEKDEGITGGGHGEEGGDGRHSTASRSNDGVGRSLSVASSSAAGAYEELRSVMGVGLAAGGAPPFRLPGCDAASVGFLSTGRVFLNGLEHMQKATSWHRRSWGATNSTIGCGFDPTIGKLFFTLNGEMVEEVVLNGDDLAFAHHPLFPTIAANYDVAMTINFGQAPFEYELANARRVPDPCFRRPLPKSASMGVEDSGEFFSMGRINSQWLTEVPAESPVHYFRVSNPLHQRQSGAGTLASDFLDSDLFEIVLESRSTS